MASQVICKEIDTALACDKLARIVPREAKTADRWLASRHKVWLANCGNGWRFCSISSSALSSARWLSRKSALDYVLQAVWLNVGGLHGRHWLGHVDWMGTDMLYASVAAACLGSNLLGGWIDNKPTSKIDIVRHTIWAGSDEKKLKKLAKDVRLKGVAFEQPVFMTGWDLLIDDQY